MMILLLSWFTRLFISGFMGIGLGCITFAIFAMTGDQFIFNFDQMSRHGPPFGPAILSLGMGFLTTALTMWLTTRKLLRAAPSTP